MVDQRKIILMTKLALYDKKYGKEDRKRSLYYLEDYVYINNFKTRVSVTMVIMIIAGIHILQMLQEGIIVPTSLMHFSQVYVKPYVIPWIIMMVVYTMISTGVHANRYALTQERRKEYTGFLRAFSQYEQRTMDDEGEEDEIK